MSTSKIKLHKASTRGYNNHGWLKTYHTFSFSGYYDPQRMHFGALRVLNDDTVDGGQGFGTHPHDNMEIISIPLKGSLEHQDSTQRREVIKEGEVQIMSAGTGIQHSEYNHSASDPVNFLQIWVFPKEKNITPRYDQKYFDTSEKKNQLVNVVSPVEGESLWINQNAWFYLAEMEEGRSLKYELNQSGNGVYAFVIEGASKISGVELNKRDGAGFYDIYNLQIDATVDTKILLMEVPMKF